MAIYDVYFRPAFSMVVAVEANSEEEAREMVEQNMHTDGDVLMDYSDLIGRFSNAYDFEGDEFEVTHVEFLDEESEDECMDYKFYVVSRDNYETVGEAETFEEAWSIGVNKFGSKDGWFIEDTLEREMRLENEI